MSVTVAQPLAESVGAAIITVSANKEKVHEAIYAQRGETINFGDRREVIRCAQVAAPSEFRLLAALAERPGHTRAPEALRARVWGSEYGDDVENVKRYSHYLRQKLEADAKHPQLILTERGFGYYLAQPTSARRLLGRVSLEFTVRWDTQFLSPRSHDGHG